MSDTPIYDALEKEYLKRGQLDAMTGVLSSYVDSIPTRYFELMDEDIEEVPALLANAARAVGNLLLPGLKNRQDEVETDRELAAYVGGILDALEALRSLGPPAEFE